MKYKNLFVLLMFSLLLAVFPGCNDDDGDNGNPADDGDGDGDPVTAFPEYLYGDLAEDFFIGSLESALSEEAAALDALANGYVSYAYTNDFTGPDGTGWYSYSYTDGMGSGNFKVRYTPDIWADASADTNKVEVQFTLTSDLSGYNVVNTFSWDAHYSDAGKTTLAGSIDMLVSMTDGDGDSDVTRFTTTMSNVSVDPYDYTGTYSATGSWNSDMFAFNVTSLSVQATFNANGSGTGTGKINGQEVARFTFAPVADNGYEQTVTYTLSTENWGTQHSTTMWR